MYTLERGGLVIVTTIARIFAVKATFLNPVCRVFYSFFFSSFPERD